MKQTNFKNKSVRALLITFSVGLVINTAILTPSSSAYAPTIRQGTTSSYGVLAGSTITNTGATSISGTAGGNLGLHPGTSFTDNGTVTLSGVTHITDTAAEIAKTDLITAYNDLGVDTATTLANGDLAGQTITPGNYSTTAGTFSNSGTVTFDAQGDSAAIFIFRAASTVINSSASTMTLTNGAQACNVYWQVGSSATIASGSTFVGHVYAMESITAVTGARIYGQLLARTSAVTLDTNTIINNACTTPVVATPSPVLPPSPVIPQDSSVTSISSGECTTTSDYKVTLTGNFPSKVTNIAINGSNIAASRWVYSESNVVITIPASNQKIFKIDLYNGRSPIIATQEFICTEAALVATPEAQPTETGGELPDTSSNGLNYLLGALGIGVLGAGGFYLRRRALS